MPRIMTAPLSLAAILAFACLAGTSTQAMALTSCPGGGTRTCTIKCTGPVFYPTCVEVEPCTCAIVDKNTSASTQAVQPTKKVPPLRVPKTTFAPSGGLKATPFKTPAGRFHAPARKTMPSAGFPTFQNRRR